MGWSTSTHGHHGQVSTYFWPAYSVALQRPCALAACIWNGTEIMGVELPTGWPHTGTISQHYAQFAHCCLCFALGLGHCWASRPLTGSYFSSVFVFAIEQVLCCHQAYYPVRSSDEILERCISHHSAHQPSSLSCSEKMTQQFSLKPKKSWFFLNHDHLQFFTEKEKDDNVFFFFLLWAKLH